MKINYRIFLALALLGTIISRAQVATSYTFSQQNGTYTPITGGTVVGFPTDDDMGYDNLPIGFSFKYDGACYNEFSATSNGYIMLGSNSNSTDYDALENENLAIAPLNDDIQFGLIKSATVTIGSPVAIVSTTYGLSVGDEIQSGYGFPASTSITAIGANQFTATAAATSSIVGGQIRFLNGEMRCQTIGIAPNRTLVAQWKNSRKYGSVDGRDDWFNFQVRLEEATSKISFVYGTVTSNTITNSSIDVGINGVMGSTDYNLRTITGVNTWTSTTLGTFNSDKCTLSNTLVPQSGLTFNWSTNLTSPASPTLSITGSTLICPNNSLSLTVSGASTYTWNTTSNATLISVSPSVTTIYSVVGQATNDCQATKNHTVIVGITPTITVNSGAVCTGNAFTITPSGASTYTYSGGSAVVSPTATSSYTVSGTSAAGCVGNVATSNVTVNTNPTVTAVSNQTNFICSGQSANLTASGASTYSWSNSSTGANISVSPTVTTSYTVMGTAANGCMANAVVSQSVSACTGFAINNINYNAFHIYPNPFSNKVTVVTATANAVIHVIDALGKVIYNQTATTISTEIDLTNYNNGLYFVKVGTEVKRIIKN